jgi:hypothetical protein
VFSLSSGQFELLCDIWLELQHEDYYLRLPVGGTMEGIDIIGTSRGVSEIAAQVTLKDNQDVVEDKKQSLERYGIDTTKRYLFARGKYSNVANGSDVEFYSAERVFEEVNDDSDARQHLDAMIELSRISRGKHG